MIRLIEITRQPDRRPTHREVRQYEGCRMKDEYDFSKAERGKFFREGARLRPSVYLEPDVLDYLAERASARAVWLSSPVNTLLRKNIELD
jgi:hypothetical protein